MAAPVLALVAVGVHFSLNVPDNPPPSPKEKNDGAKSKARAKKAKQRSKRRQFEARSDDELDRAWHRYRRLDFAREPELATWSRRTESIVNRAVAVARKTAFEGAPEEPRVGVSDTECRTVRCRFVLRSPYGHELGILRNTMKRLEADEEPVWRHFEARRIAPPEGSPEDESYLEVMVALRSDEIRSARLEVAESSPAKAGAEAEAEIDSDSDSDAESPND